MGTRKYGAKIDWLPLDVVERDAERPRPDAEGPPTRKTNSDHGYIGHRHGLPFFDTPARPRRAAGISRSYELEPSHRRQAEECPLQPRGYPDRPAAAPVPRDTGTPGQAWRDRPPGTIRAVGAESWERMTSVTVTANANPSTQPPPDAPPRRGRSPYRRRSTAMARNITTIKSSSVRRSSQSRPRRIRTHAVVASRSV